MDTVNHAAWGYAFAKTLDAPVELVIASVVIGAAPDIIGWVEKVVFRDSSLWGWYKKAHNLNYTMLLLPPYYLHVLLDKFTHGEGKRWWKIKERLWAEVLSWVIVLCLSLY